MVIEVFDPISIVFCYLAKYFLSVSELEILGSSTSAATPHYGMATLRTHVNVWYHLKIK